MFAVTGAGRDELPQRVHGAIGEPCYEIILGAETAWVVLFIGD